MIKMTRAELNEKYHICQSNWATKHDLVMEHLSNYMEITESKEKGYYVYEIAGEVPDIIPPIPRKRKSVEAQKDYDEFVQQYFNDSKPRYASEAEVARAGIAAFGMKKYRHHHVGSVVRRYISSSFKKYVEEVPNSDCWIWQTSYEPLDDYTLQRWLNILEEEHITEKEQAAAFRDFVEGLDITEAIDAYRRAISRFYEEFNDYTVKVPQYLLKT